jgi:hypothetical protein
VDEDKDDGGDDDNDGWANSISIVLVPLEDDANEDDEGEGDDEEAVKEAVDDDRLVVEAW